MNDLNAFFCLIKNVSFLNTNTLVGPKEVKKTANGAFLIKYKQTRIMYFRLRV